MKPKSYWQTRSEQIASRQFRKADGYERVLNKEYIRANNAIRREIDVFYSRFANNNGIVDMVEARKLLDTGELSEFKMTLEEFIEKAMNNADGRWTKQLNNVYYRTRISRYAALQIQIGQHIEMLSGSKQQGMWTLLGESFTDTYYRTMHEIQSGTGIGYSFAKIDNQTLEKTLNTRLSGNNWSERIWMDRNKLRSEIHTKLSQSFIRGDSIDRTTRDLMERMNVSYSNAQRLVQTETAFFTEQATMESYKESGVFDQYEILATLDNRTSDICQSMDGKVFKLSEMEVGVSYPPFHVRCRTTVVPYFDDDLDVGERIARSEDGSTYYVPGDISYPDWKKKYVDSPNLPESAIINPNTFRRFETPNQVKEWENLVTPAWKESLTAQEANDITKYTGSMYYNINKNLRAGGGDERYDGMASNISSGIGKFNLLENITVYRGLDQNIFSASAGDLPGVTFMDNAFMSTTLLEEKLFSGTVQMEIRVPAKSRGAPINPLSNFKDQEFEFLLDAGTEFRIIEAKEEGGKLRLITEVVENDD